MREDIGISIAIAAGLLGVVLTVVGVIALACWGEIIAGGVVAGCLGAAAIVAAW